MVSLSLPNFILTSNPSFQLKLRLTQVFCDWLKKIHLHWTFELIVLSKGSFSPNFRYEACDVQATKNEVTNIKITK